MRICQWEGMQGVGQCAACHEEWCLFGQGWQVLSQYILSSCLIQVPVPRVQLVKAERLSVVLVSISMR